MFRTTCWITSASASLNHIEAPPSFLPSCRICSFPNLSRSVIHIGGSKKVQKDGVCNLQPLKTFNHNVRTRCANNSNIAPMFYYLLRIIDDNKPNNEPTHTFLGGNLYHAVHLKWVTRLWRSLEYLLTCVQSYLHIKQLLILKSIRSLSFCFGSCC